MSQRAEEHRERVLARTYGNERDGWERVEEYRRVREYVDSRPGVNSATVASALDLPRSRIRSWVDGAGRPDPVRAIQLAAERGWLDAEPGDPVFEALVVCHAWVYAGGSIAAENYRPSFAVNGDDPETTLLACLEALDLDYRRYRDDVDRRATEIVPADHGVVLGRYLAGVLDAPTGPKDSETAMGLPGWLSGAPYETRRRWARTYVMVRGCRREDRAGGVQLVERRTDVYRNALRAFLEDLVEHPEWITLSGDTTVYVRPPAADRLYTRPTIGVTQHGTAASD
jgi:hypothetical protein